MKLVKSIAILSLLAFTSAAYAQNPVGAAAGAAGAAVGGAASTVGGAANGAAGAVTGTANSAAKAAKPRSAKSLECSKQADSQGLHGKDRKHFMSKSKKG